MPTLNYKSPGDDDVHARLRRWENWILAAAACAFLLVLIFYALAAFS